ncbi:hypothetical protein PABG_07184 [Paracoccidioides brasiliensis Pb03]|nr:hypothetical protein PABG_07184 [Paracoccidioides brasiliensis Pb03]
MGNVVGATPKAAFDLVNGKTFVALATAALGAGVEVVEFRVVVGESAERKTVMVTVWVIVVVLVVVPSSSANASCGARSRKSAENNDIHTRQQQQQQPERKIDIEIEMLRATRMGEILQGIKRSRFTRGFTSGQEPATCFGRILRKFARKRQTAVKRWRV